MSPKISVMTYFKQWVIYIVSLPFRVISFYYHVGIKLGKNSCVVGGVKVAGRHERIEVGDNTILTGCKFIFKGNHNKVHIGNHVRLRNVVFWFEDDNNKITIDDGTTMEGNTQLAACESTNIFIGKDCMFANNVNLRTTDSHPILDSYGSRINPAADIKISNHVWIGTYCLVLKGSSIPENCIIGACSLVTSAKTKYTNSIYCGNPVKLVRQGVNWERFRESVKNLQS